jgi:hypothetical protein
MMGAVRTSETLINSYQSTCSYNPEGSQLHTHRCENLKSYLENVFVPNALLVFKLDSKINDYHNGKNFLNAENGLCGKLFQICQNILP